MRTALEHGMREHVLLQFRGPSNAVVPVIYWITPKSAHTTILGHSTRGDWLPLEPTLDLTALTTAHRVIRSIVEDAQRVSRTLRC